MPREKRAQQMIYIVIDGIFGKVLGVFSRRQDAETHAGTLGDSCRVEEHVIREEY